jgi:hypothetical protein
MGNSASGETVLPKDLREWAFTAELDNGGKSVLAYAYLDRQQSADLWRTRYRQSRTERVQVAAPGRDPLAWPCTLLLEGGFGPSIEIREQSDGRVTSKGKLRRLVDVMVSYAPHDR